MISSILIILLLVESCPANKRVDPTFPPRSNGRKTSHISEFTDPATGLNPFLDLEEGRAGEIGRNIVEEDVLPRTLSDTDLQLFEGGPDDRDRPRWNEDFSRRWGNFNNEPVHVIPTSRSSDVERQAGDRKYDTFSTSTEVNRQASPNVFISTTRNSDESDYYTLRPISDSNSDTDYNNEFHEAERTVVQEGSAHLKKFPVSKNIVISAAIIGSSVAVIGLLLAICWWRQKMKRISTRGNANTTDNNIESIISDKVSTNNGIQKKSILV